MVMIQLIARRGMVRHLAAFESARRSQGPPFWPSKMRMAIHTIVARWRCIFTGISVPLKLPKQSLQCDRSAPAPTLLRVSEPAANRNPVLHLDGHDCIAAPPSNSLLHRLLRREEIRNLSYPQEQES